MALADYFHRAAAAASQVLQGYRPEEVAALVSRRTFGIAVGSGDLRFPHKIQAADLAVRLAARLYPRIVLQTDTQSARVESLAALARAINPRIEVVFNETADVGVVIGASHRFRQPFYLGGDDWRAFLSTVDVQTFAEGQLPFGSGTAAALGMANVFRAITGVGVPDESIKLDTRVGPADGRETVEGRADEIVLVGCGAIGNAAVWALRYVPHAAVLHLVDDERIDLGNLQRYVMASRADVGRAKVDVLARHLQGPVKPVRHRMTLRGFLRRYGYRHGLVLAAVDSAASRIDLQSSLPRAVINGWTQVGDLGVSAHGRFGGPSACLACLYQPTGPSKSDDQVVAEALGIPQWLMEVRNLLHLGGPVPEPLLNEISQGLGLDPADVKAFSGRPLRELYVEGICGGGLVVPEPTSPQEYVHVPLAHQSALAGILLAACAYRRSGEGGLDEVTLVTRLDVTRPLGSLITQPAAAAPDGGCICQDDDFRLAYLSKWAS
jgi:hypothetical protein